MYVTQNAREKFLHFSSYVNFSFDFLSIGIGIDLPNSKREKLPAKKEEIKKGKEKTVGKN